MPSKSAMVAAAVAGTTKAESMPALKIASLASLRALSQEALCDRARKSGDTLASHQIELGKVIFLLDETRPEKVVLKKHVRKTLGVELEPAPYKVASAFRMVGEGHGTVTEKQFDACQLRWLFIVSAILNLMAKDAGKPEEMPVEEVAVIREQVAKAIRDLSKDTGKVLKLIYDTLRPEKAESDGDGETEEGEVPADWKPHVRALRDYIEKGEGQSVADLNLLAQMLEALRENATEKVAVINAAVSAQPAAEMAQAA